MKSRSAAAFAVFLLAGSLASQDSWFMAQTEVATVRACSATSELVEGQFGGKYLYPPINILDGDLSTTWCEADAGGSGIGESLIVELESAVSFDEIQVVNGFASGNDFYHKNNRVSRIQITQVAGGHFQQKSYALEDEVAGWQSIKFPLAQTVQVLTIKIEAVYRGYKYDDTCLSDIRLLYQGRIIPFANVDSIRIAQEENSRMMLGADAENFGKNFLALFKAKRGGEGFLPLVLIGSDDEGFLVHRKGDKIELVESVGFVKPPKKTEIATWLSKRYLEDPSLVKNYDPAKFDYFRSFEEDEGPFYFSLPPEYALAPYRIIETAFVDYVEVVSVFLIKPDGTKGMYINGVYYRLVDPERVYLP